MRHVLNLVNALDCLHDPYQNGITACRFTAEEFEALPETVQPLFAHLAAPGALTRADGCSAELRSHTYAARVEEEPEEGDLGHANNLSVNFNSRNLIQPLNQARGRAAFQRTAEGFFDADGRSNAHVRVQIRTDAAL